MLSGFFNAIFKFPPVAERYDIRKSIMAKILYGFPMTPEKDDMYLYYQAVLTAWYISLALMLPFIFAYHLDHNLSFPLMRIEVSHSDKMRGVLNQYIDTVQHILFYGVYIFFLIKLRWNIDIKKYDILWHSSVYSDRNKRTPWYILPRMITGGVLFFIACRNLDLVVELWSSESLLFFILSQLLVSFWHAVFTLYIFLAVAISWRYIGKHEGK